jgi:hypothetical protein
VQPHARTKGIRVYRLYYCEHCGENLVARDAAGTEWWELVCPTSGEVQERVHIREVAELPPDRRAQLQRLLRAAAEKSTSAT